MAAWLDRVERRVNARGSRRPVAKAFSMPPFWSDGARVALSTAGVTPGRESAAETFEQNIQGLYKGNGIVFACIAARLRVFSQARFAFQRFIGGRPTELFGGDALRLLERPWPKGTTARLLAEMEIDVSAAGNFLATLVDEDGKVGRAARNGNNPFISRMRPDWCQFVIDAPSGNPFGVDARVVALWYRPPGGTGNDPLILLPDEFCHYAPLPDGIARYRGMSWLTPILRDVLADAAYTSHKLSFLRQGANPNMVINLGDDIEDEDFQTFVAEFREMYEGADNAYKTMFLAGAADVTPLSMSFEQLDLKSTQGAGETRIAAAAGVHPSIAGLSEGLGGSSLNAGNFGAARRLFVDSTIRNLWSAAAPALEAFTPPPEPTRQRLWYDDRDIPFLREDTKDEAGTFFVQAQAARQLVEAGWEPDAAISAAKARDISVLLGKHTGMLSVQLHAPGEEDAPDDSAPMPALGAAPPAPPPTNGRQPVGAR